MAPGRPVGDAAFTVYQVHPVRHAAIGVAHAVVEVVHQQRHTDVQGITAPPRHAHALGFVVWLLDGNADFVIGRQPPTIGGVGLADVDRNKLNAVAITPLQVFQGPKLGPKWPSGEATENQNHWL